VPEDAGRTNEELKSDWRSQAASLIPLAKQEVVNIFKCALKLLKQ
jgi:hypothetical protein